jgi:hypothetical protein
VHAGRTAGCRTIFVDYGYPRDQPHAPDKLVHSLREEADFSNDNRSVVPPGTQWRVVEFGFVLPNRNL